MKYQNVPLVDIREQIPRSPNRKILLKVDIEGQERKIIPALIELLPETVAIFMEWHHGLDSFVSFERQLVDAGFDVTRLRVWHPDLSGPAFVDCLAQRCISLHLSA
jgi:hypothetical protein